MINLPYTLEEYFADDSYRHISEINRFYEDLGHDGTDEAEWREFLYEGFLVILRSKEVMVGYMIISYSLPKLGNDFFDAKTDGYLFQLYLADEIRGHGIGTKLIHYAEQKTLDYGRNRLFVETHYMNSGMEKLLNNLGYKFVEKRDYTKQYKDIDSFYLLYVKSL
ncbi:MAG: GNAT family N-acetyltransferase [Patescibacteria group bacterium]